MNAFLTVAERRSFAKAAVQLGISRSRLSETIRALEDKLSVRLLNRTTRSVAPTAVGERLLARLRPLLDDFDSALDSINAFRDKPAGRLRLTVLPPAANLMLAPLLSRFLAQYPAIDLEISIDAALTDIVAGRFDAGIRPGERVERDMIAVRIGEEMRGVLVAAPDYLARHPRPTTPRDLETHSCIRFRFPSGVIAPWHFEKKGKQVEVAVEGRLTVNDEELAIRAARRRAVYGSRLCRSGDQGGPAGSLAGGLAAALSRNLSVLSEPATDTAAAAGVHRVPAGEPAGALRREGVMRPDITKKDFVFTDQTKVFYETRLK
jgi:DNA-binding transcriptional LysR family regulator